MGLNEIRTARLRLRPWKPEDLDALHALWTDSGVRRYLWDDIVITRETAAEVLTADAAMVAQHGFGCWSVFVEPIEDTAAVDGFCGFRFDPHSNPDAPDVELLYGLLPRHWGKGLATEASAAVLDYFWKTTAFDRVIATTDRPNAASVRVMRRLGMTLFREGPASITYELKRPQTPTADN